MSTEKHADLVRFNHYFERLQQTIRESAKRLLELYRDPVSGITKLQQRLYFTRVYMNRLSLLQSKKYGKPIWDEVRICEERGINRYVLMSEAVKALRGEVEIAVQELLRQQGKPKNWTGTISYHGFKIVVSRPKSFTWEQNTNPAVTSDPNHAIYVQQLELQKRINEQLKDMRADVKRTAEKLEKAHPESDCIKHGFRLAFMQ